MTRSDLVCGLRELGLSKGSIVILHSSLSSLGRVEGGADTVVDAFLEAVGPSGTLLVPTSGDLGVIPNTVKQRPEAVESLQPRASVAAIGAEAEVLCADHWKAQTAHAEDTPYHRVAQRGGYICLLGVDQDRNTSLHTAEELLRLPYLSDTPEYTLQTPEGCVTKAWTHFPGPHRDFIGLDRLFRERGVAKVGRIGEAVVRLMKAEETADTLTDYGRAHPDFALCDNENCADCVIQRAGLARARLVEESFSLATSSALAGHYVPEILDNCAAAGVDAVELDLLEGQPVQGLPHDRIAEVIAEIEDGGCTVTGVRCSAVSGDSRLLIESVGDWGVGRIVFPITEEAEELAAMATRHGLEASFFNQGLGSDLVRQRMLRLAEKGLQAGLTFSAANFARAGEKPFLTSYGNKLKRHTDQLDVSDCTFDGRPTRLAGGNAEIKELVSIFRCSHFSGLMVLTADNVAAGGLREVAHRFFELLDAM